MIEFLRRQSKRIFGDHAYVTPAFFDQAIVSGTSFLTSILLARLLGPESFGRFVLAWFTVYLFQNLRDALVTAPMLTLAQKYSASQRPAYFGTLLLHQAAMSVASAAVVFLGFWASTAFVPSWRLDELALPTALLVAIGQLPEFARIYHFVTDRGHRSAAINALRFGVQTALLLALFFVFAESASVSLALWLMVFATLPAAVLSWVWQDPVRYQPDIARAATAQHWRFSRWLFGSSLAYVGRENIVSIIVGAVLGLAEVGILRAAQQLVLAVNVPLQALGNVIPTRASKAYVAGGSPALVDFIKAFAWKFVTPLAALLLIIAWFGTSILTLVYGEAYADHGWVVSGFALAMLVYLARDIAVVAIRATEQTSVEFRASAIAAVVAIIAIYPLVTTFGIYGAILADALFNAIVFVIAARAMRRILLPEGKGRHTARASSDAETEARP